MILKKWLVITALLLLLCFPGYHWFSEDSAVPSRPAKRKNFTSTVYLKPGVLSQKYNIPPNDIAHSLFLVGDAGKPNRSLLKTLKDEIETTQNGSTVLYLGDNLYTPKGGMPGLDDPNRNWAENVVRKQVEVIKSTKSSEVIFTNGNHDWESGGKGGFDSVRRFESYLNENFKSVQVLPKQGCPGPAISELTPKMALILLDSQWWLHKWSKGGPPACESGTTESIQTALKLSLEQQKKRHMILSQHHPLVSFGVHANDAKCPQDLNCPLYQNMRETITAALRAAPPLLCAAGHDHSLQLIEGDEFCQYYLVSGAGARPTTIVPGEGLLFGFDGLGFFRLDQLNDGAFVLTAIGIDAQGERRELFSRELKTKA